MAKIFYNLQTDIVDKELDKIGLLDILKANKCNIMTEFNQLRGEKIEVAYIFHEEKLLSQLGDLNIKKISVFSKGDDEFVIPKNFIKYSSDKMITMGGKYYNVILNHKNYKTDNEIIIQGDDNIHQDVIRNVYTLFGNVIMSTTSMYEKADIEHFIMSRNIPNTGRIYYNVFTTLEGLKKCLVKKNIIKVKPNEHFSDLHPIINYFQSTPVDQCKLVTTNLGLHKVSKLRFSLSEHLIAGKYEQLSVMYNNAMNILLNKVCDIRKKLRLEYTPEQILYIGYLRDKLDFIGARDENYVKDIMTKTLHIIPIDELGNYMIPCEKQLLMSGKLHDKSLYDALCEIKTIKDI